jgi:hypothetical protein
LAGTQSKAGSLRLSTATAIPSPATTVAIGFFLCSDAKRADRLNNNNFQT